MTEIRTGIFWNDIFKGSNWPIIGDKFKHFPDVLKSVLKYDNVRLYRSPKAPIEILKEVHSERLVNSFINSWYAEGGLYTIGGFMDALEKIWINEITNGLNFMVAVGHHAGKESAWGGTYASLTGPGIANLRRKFPNKEFRFAIIDTDSHHADGTRDMFLGDHNVLHVCFCDDDTEEDEGTKFCVDVGWYTDDNSYLQKVKDNFIKKTIEFKPDIIIHLLGHDTHHDDYGSRGLSKDFFLKLVNIVNNCALKICNGRYLITTMGGDNVKVADYIFPRIVEILSARGK
ncbi:MAG: hypothetical protein ACTSPY_06535 [Candidatus Helarchaeota archaeon]